MTVPDIWCWPTDAYVVGTTPAVGEEYRSNWIGAVYPLGGSQAVHTGDDIVVYNMPGALRGHPIYAIHDGTVIFAHRVYRRDGTESTWGLLVVISHQLPDGSIVYSRYAHCLDKNPLVH